ncbi:hypothetical protein FRAHR75_330038 [Frankia sp. Hr75.2]|nr:hypothetical protein FRAHR75_330038 [Frankia sp. Hr75.2]
MTSLWMRQRILVIGLKIAVSLHF